MSHHLLTLSPTDVLFFRDGRPMDGASSGHGAAWPMPNVLSAALHHALRRAELADLHAHGCGRSSLRPADAERTRWFGSLQVAGPFPVLNGQWLFPRPVDAASAKSSATTHHPLGQEVAGAASSLKGGLLPVINKLAPSKEKAEPWLTSAAYAAYLEDGGSSLGASHFVKDEQIFGAEHNIGIGIDPETDSQDGKRFYSASYLRLRENVQIGLVAQCMDKGLTNTTANNDLIAAVFPNSGQITHIVAGGQQRTCTVERHGQAQVPMPAGPIIRGTRVRWSLLTPAIFPQLLENPSRAVPSHPGGWLPTWIHPDSLEIQLKDPEKSARKNGEGRSAWRQRVAALAPIRARLVAASIARAIPVTGWALPNGGEAETAGARATHLAVPAGGVYYFEAHDEAEAQKLAAALNWNGSDPEGHHIVNRRSTLMGEKGFGLGVCSAWSSHHL